MPSFDGGYDHTRPDSYDNTYLTAATRTILAYRDTNLGDMNSPISLYKHYEIPQNLVPDSGITPDQISGMNLLWDGRIAVATRFGYVGVVDIETGRGSFKKVADGETISNSIAVASDGGIYVVSNKALYRFQWNPSASWDAALKSPIDSPASCNLCWRQTYLSGTNATGTYSDGSGSTPSLMGPGGEYVVITDGSTVANLSVYRTGSLGNGQQRLAAKIPVNFGQPNRAQTSTEQSVVVSDYGMAVVSNDYRNLKSLGDHLPLVLRPLVNSLLSLPVMKNISNAKVTLTGYGPNHQPWGVQKFSFDPSTSTIKSDWVRLDVSCPNGVPVMSQGSRRFYCIGAKDSVWTLESLDWDTGNDHFRASIGALPRFNSFYSALQLTSDGGILYGSVNGVVYLPKRQGGL